MNRKMATFFVLITAAIVLAFVLASGQTILQFGTEKVYAQDSPELVRGDFPKEWGRLVKCDLRMDGGEFDKSMFVFEAPDGTIRITTEEYASERKNHPVTVMVYRRN